MNSKPQLLRRLNPVRCWHLQILRTGQPGLKRNSLAGHTPGNGAPARLRYLRGVVTNTFDYDVAIVGAGPAGSACALALRRSGLRVALLDKATFPRDKVCGDAVPGHALKALRQLDPAFWPSPVAAGAQGRRAPVAPGSAQRRQP